MPKFRIQLSSSEFPNEHTSSSPLQASDRDTLKVSFSRLASYGYNNQRRAKDLNLNCRVNKHYGNSDCAAVRKNSSC